jgi:hypothetical protein
VRQILQREVEAPLAEWIVASRRRAGLVRAVLGTTLASKCVQYVWEE